MTQKSFIVIIGEYSPGLSCVREVMDASKEAEINFFDMPNIGSKDTVERINEQLLIHHYAQLSEFEIQVKQYIRDIVALGAEKHYFCKSNDKHNNILECIKRGLEMYSIKYKEL